MKAPERIDTIHTEDAPAAVGPYSQAVRAGDFLFLSGQIPLDPKTMELVEGDIQEQTHRVIANLQAVIEAAGADLSRVVKTTVYLEDIADFAAVNEAYAGHFSGSLPARAAFQVAALPKGARVEIEAVAYLGP
jgi:2-iminobutanoate/2-iminopropanoate deaminase